MTDYVSASASRMRSLAREIKECSDAILSDEPGIKSGIEGWEAGVDTNALRNLAGWLKDEAGPMLDRAAWAETALNQPGPVTVNRAGDWRTVPWNITPELQRQEGYADSAQLARLMQSKDPKVRDQAAREAAWAMEAHVDDPEWLEAFFTTGGAQVLSSLPRHLLARDGATLSEDSKQTLRWYSLGIAKATKLQEQHKITLPGTVWDPIFHPAGDDLWSSGMLVAHGPKGDQYGSQFLAGLAGGALDWKEEHGPMRPSYSAPRMAGNTFVPGGYVQNDGDWWTSLGIDVDYLDTDAKDAEAGIAKIRANDPLSFILGRTGENPEASRALLSVPNDPTRAKQLVDVHWQTPGPVPLDDSGPASLVIRAATFDRKEHGKDSANAALNVIRAANFAYRSERNAYDNEQYPKLPSALTKGLSFVAATYGDDLAGSTDTADLINGVADRGVGGLHFQTNSTEIDGFLHALMSDPAATGALEGALRARLTLSAQLQSTDPSLPDYLEDLGRLLGAMNLTANDMKFDAAEAKDKDNANHRVYFDALTGVASGLPGLPDAQTFLVVISSELAAANGDALFPTDNATKAADASQAVTYRNLQGMRIEIAQGLLQSGTLTPPVGRSFCQGGVIKIRTEQEAVEFKDWWSTVGSQATDFEDRAQKGFMEANAIFAANANKHGK
ncbi:hypothetical protein [Streptomyces sp. SID13031]|uniref:hypothetical protein n=1 Tax=Streptomyces sp. SID13031 TaxID=2706046 RepID=UPI0013CCEB7D|nr:hypothetical protein [Streptomyces sp. SID13031]NEA33155.1 hypothetical protein [Streptomyces sp. SID13031]